MQDEVFESARRGESFQILMQDSKTQRPPARRAGVTRRALIEQATAGAASVVAVIAAAGYGKSTFLAEWADSEERPVAWVSLDRGDDDPATLLSLIAASCASISPTVASLASGMRGMGASSLGRSAPLLAAALHSIRSGFVLFIDDLHWADSPDCQDALEVVLSRIPEGSQVVLASRREPAMLAALRVAGTTWELRAEDLSLDDSAARTLFADAGLPDIDDADLATIVRRCEGWPTGLYLFALVARAGGKAVEVSGDDPFVADYLYHECVTRLPEDTQSFLRRTSVLDQLSPSLCNAVARRDDALAVLQDLERANLFLLPLDRHRTWYRYHPLFREFLLTELERVEGATVVADLHRRAAG